MTKNTSRTDSLAPYNILDTPKETAYDDLIHCICDICKVPIAFVGILDDTREWFKSCVGLSVKEIPREVAICSHTIQQDDLFFVHDTLEDPRFRDNPLVTGEPEDTILRWSPFAR